MTRTETSIETEELWVRVQRALDRRRDPLADARVRAGLSQHPEARAEIERMLSLVGELDAPIAGRRRPAAALVGLALASAAGLAFLLSRAPTEPQGSSDPSPPRRASRVLSVRMTTERRDADGALIERRDVLDHEQRTTVQLRPRPAAGSRTPNAATLVAWTETETRP